MSSGWIKFWLCTAMLMSTTWAAERWYEAPLDNAHWETRGTRLRCELSQEIPLFGKARFIAQAGPPNLTLQFESKRMRGFVTRPAVWRSEPPDWRPQQQEAKLAEIQVKATEVPAKFDDDDAWRALAELERGFHPALRFSDWIDGRDTVVVRLSSVRFLATYPKFLDCMAKLLPFTFEDIRNTVLNFEFDSVKLTRDSKLKLKRLLAWVKADPDVELVLVLGHTDSRGRRLYNKRLGQKRAEAIKRQLIQAGLPKQRIVVRSYGERAPVASNAHPLGRAKNRRVVVRLYKDDT